MNSDDFLDYYNKIDLFLRRAGNHDPEVTFAQKVKTSSNAVVKRYKNELLSLGELRNAIVHYPKIKNKVIAEPHEEVVLQVKDLHEKITNPIKVIPEFQHEVLGAHEDDFINNILLVKKFFDLITAKLLRQILILCILRSLHCSYIMYDRPSVIS